AHVVALAAPLPLREKLQPARADHGEEHIGLAERFLRLLVEPLASQQIVHVHEDVGVAELGGQAVADAGGYVPSIVAPVVDEDFPGMAPARQCAKDTPNNNYYGCRGLMV